MKTKSFFGLRRPIILCAGFLLQVASLSASAFWTNTANDLSTLYNSDTLATSQADTSGTGYLQSSNYKFLESSLPSGRNLTVAGGSTQNPGDPDIPFAFDDNGANDNSLLMGTIGGVAGYQTSVDVDVTDSNYNEVAVLFSAVGLNDNSPGPNLQGSVTLNYVGGATTTLTWNLADSDGCCVVAGEPATAATNLTLVNSSRVINGRNWYYQTFAVDDAQLLKSITLVSDDGTGFDGISNNAEIGVYSISAFDATPAPEGSIVMLFAVGLTVLGYTRRKQLATDSNTANHTA